MGPGQLIQAKAICEVEKCSPAAVHSTVNSRRSLAQLQADVSFWSLACSLLVGSGSSKPSDPPSDLLFFSFPVLPSLLFPPPWAHSSQQSCTLFGLLVFCVYKQSKQPYPVVSGRGFLCNPFGFKHWRTPIISSNWQPFDYKQMCKDLAGVDRVACTEKPYMPTVNADS